jgi:hypothetical protein
MKYQTILSLATFALAGSIHSQDSLIPQVSQEEVSSIAFWSQTGKPMVNVNVTAEDLTMLEFFHRLELVRLPLLILEKDFNLCQWSKIYCFSNPRLPKLCRRMLF